MAMDKLIEAYEPMCEKCSDHGFLIVGYGESGSGSKQCPECKGRYVKRRKEALAALARDDKAVEDELVPRVQTTAERVWDDLKIAAWAATLPNERLFDALWERIEEPPVLKCEDPELKTVLCEVADRLGQRDELQSQLTAERMRADHWNAKALNEHVREDCEYCNQPEE